MKTMIHDALSQMTHSNKRTPCTLQGGAFCASFEVPPTGKPWVQAKIGVINIHYPFEQSPHTIFEQRRLDDIPLIAFPAWNSNKYATITFEELAVEDYTNFIDRLFRELYDLPTNYTVNTDIFDMR